MLPGGVEARGSPCIRTNSTTAGGERADELRADVEGDLRATGAGRRARRRSTRPG